MTKRLMAKCEHCGDWFPSTIINTPSPEMTLNILNSNTFRGIEKCTVCGKEAKVSNDNLRVM